MENIDVSVEGENIKKLDEIIDKQIELHEELKNLLGQKREYIQNREIDKLEMLVSKEEKVILDINEAENEREKLIAEIANSMNIDKGVRAIELCEKLPQPHSIHLMMKFVRLMELINDIAILNMGIKNMLEFENTYIELTMRLLSGNLKRDILYTNNGKHKEDTPSSLLDGRV